MGGTQRDSRLRSTVDDRCRRRAFLLGAGVALAGAAGCTGSDDDPGGTDNSTGPADDSAEYAAGSGPAEVVAWNRELFGIIRFTSETPTETVRRMGILTTAMFDAATTVTAARGQSHYEPYGSYDGAPADGSPLAALGGAAHEALGTMYPEVGDGLDDRLSGTLATASESEGDLDAGEQWGRSVGQRAVERRVDDGHDDLERGGYEPCPGEPAKTPGCWRGGSLGTWRDSHYAFLDTWVLDGPVTFDGPPPLDSEAYAEGWQEVYDIGDDRNREDRPQEHIDIARYWRGGAGTTRPSGRWLRIANIAVESGEFEITTLETARLMALVSLAVGDAGISAWHGKHEHGFWRPAEAIPAGDTDGNPDTFADTDWESIAIGSSPEYPSSLAAFAGAGQTVLSRVLGTDEFAFEMTSSGPPELTRSFESFSEAASESLQSRLYVGNHFPFSLADGRTAGETIGETVLDSVLRPVE